MKQIILLCCCLLWMAEAMLAQPFNISTTLNKNKIQTGEIVEVSISLTWLPAFYQLKPLAIPDTLGPFEHLGSHSIAGKKDAEHQQQSFQLNFTVFDAGNYILPPIPISFYSPSQNRDTILYTLPQRITVIEPKVDTTQTFKPIQPIVDAVRPWQDRIKQYAWIFLLLMTLSIVAWWWFKHKKKEKPIPAKAAMPQTSPYTSAWQQLQKLQQEAPLPPQGEKVFYTELTDTIRTYFELRFQLPCFDKTGTEITESCKEQSQLKPLVNIIDAFFTEADLIKFAKAQGNETTRMRDIQRALHILETTKPTNP